MRDYSFCQGLAFLYTYARMAPWNSGNATSSPYVSQVATLGFVTGVVSLTKAFLDSQNMKTRRGKSPRAVIS